jgi:hypothetical protein
MSFKGLDGLVRDEATEELLNEATRLVFGTPAGEFLLRYLDGITIRAIGGPHISDGELRHREGQRFIVGLLHARLHQPKRETPDVRASDPEPERSIASYGDQ